MVRDIREIVECPDCASMDLVYNDKRQQVICKDCGLIYEPLTPPDEQSYFNPGSVQVKSEPKTTKPKKAAKSKPAKKSKPKKKATKKKRRKSTSNPLQHHLFSDMALS